jgi:hypothetical protein
VKELEEYISISLLKKISNSLLKKMLWAETTGRKILGCGHEERK